MIGDVVLHLWRLLCDVLWLVAVYGLAVVLGVVLEIGADVCHRVELNAGPFPQTEDGRVEYPNPWNQLRR